MMNEQETPDYRPSGSTRLPGKGLPAWQVILLMLLTALLSGGAVLAVLALGVTRYSIADSRSGTDMSVLTKLMSDVQNYYYFSDDLPSSEKLLDGAAQGLVDSVGDPYADYYSVEEFESFRNQLAGNFKGIGVLISQAEKGTLINRVYEDSPAAKAGLLDNDVIIAVDGKSVVGMDVNTVSTMVGGEDGTSVALTVLRGDETLTIPVVRGDVYVRRVSYELLDNNIGYLRIDSFTGNAEAEFNDVVDILLKRGIKSLIIDLRNNPGGELETVVKICDRVLPACTITTIEGKLANPATVYKSSADESLDLPIVVLTNGYSASASEIFAAAIQDNKAGIIMGTNTFGKGIVQTSWQLMPGKGYIKLTTDVYKTPNGRMIHGIGVAPDVVVEQDPELANTDIFFIRRDMPERDLQVNAAVDYLISIMK